MIELIAVITVIGLISVVGVSTLITAQVRGTRASVVALVRQEGNFAAGTIGYWLRNAVYLVPNRDGVTCASGMTALRWRNPDDGQQEIALDSDRLASNSGIVVTDPPAGYVTTNQVVVTNLGFDCQQTAGEIGALVTFHFTVTAGSQSGASEAYYTQDFTSSAYVRSRP